MPARATTLLLFAATMLGCHSSRGPIAAAAMGADAGPSNCVPGGSGRALHVAAAIDLCLPAVVCNSETCPPQLGRCDAGACVFNPGYRGLQTLPQAWATWYCTLSTGSCDGVTQLEPPAITAAKVAAQFGLSLCAQAGAGEACAGIAAGPPMEVGNSQAAVDPRTGQPVHEWGRGLTEASGLCYQLTGPGGSAVIALTDRCGGYCKCGGTGFAECGACVNAADLEVNCSCVGAVPGVSSQCCGEGCATTQPACDWCASNNHPHFDLDVDTFNHVCGAAGRAGSCQLSRAQFVPCLGADPAWPPGGGLR